MLPHYCFTCFTLFYINVIFSNYLTHCELYAGFFSDFRGLIELPFHPGLVIISFSGFFPFNFINLPSRAKVWIYDFQLQKQKYLLTFSIWYGLNHIKHFKVQYKKEQYSYNIKIEKGLNWEVKILVKLQVISFQCFNNIFTNYTHLWKHITNQNGVFHKGKSLSN